MHRGAYSQLELPINNHQARRLLQVRAMMPAHVWPRVRLHHQLGTAYELSLYSFGNIRI
jgi:hypothetical protein